MAFRGTFDHTLDAKNRLTVPARFRSVLSDGVVLAKSLERCVTLWTPPAYEAYVFQSLADLNPLSPDARSLKRFFSANAFDTELDAAGRVMVPTFLIDHADLGREVKVTGAEECLEIWDRDTWNAYDADLSARVPDIAANLANAHPA